MPKPSPAPIPRVAALPETELQVIPVRLLGDALVVRVPVPLAIVYITVCVSPYFCVNETDDPVIVILGFMVKKTIAVLVSTIDNPAVSLSVTTTLYRYLVPLVVVSRVGVV